MFFSPCARAVTVGPQNMDKPLGLPLPYTKGSNQSHGLKGSVLRKEEKHRSLDSVFHRGGSNLLQ